MTISVNHPASLQLEPKPVSRGTLALLWIIQGLLAALFLFAGAMKFVMPMDQMTKDMPLPAAFLYFIGACEVLGGLGLVLPNLLRIRQGLTPLAAIGLLIIMVGATVITATKMGVMSAVTPFVVGLLLAFVALRRWRMLA
jgi:uncharacterized membrane protein YphA (DoxX/SURF4 family)